MSGHSVSAIVLFVGVVAIALASQHADDGALRGPASISTKNFTTSEAPVLRHTTKIHGPLESRIELIGTIPENAGDVFVLKGFVSSSRDLRDVEFKWSLPAGLELVNGTTAGYISIVKAGLPSEVQVTLRSLTGENQQVHLITSGAEQGLRFAESAQFNTLIQPMIEAGKEALLKSTKESAAEDTPRLKIFH